MVARTFSDPGVMRRRVLVSSPEAAASLAIDAARVMSSYEELVQLPIRAALISSGHPFSVAS